MTMLFFREKVYAYIECLLARFVMHWRSKAMKELKVTTKCLSDEKLAAFVDHCLHPDQKMLVEAHLSECSLCRKIVVMIFKSKTAVPDVFIPPPIS